MNIKTVTNFLGFTNPTVDTTENPHKTTIEQEKAGERKILLEWTSQIRTEKKGFDKKSVRTGAVLLIVVSLLFILMQEYMLVFAIGAIIFIYYALSKAPIENVKVLVSNHGVTYGSNYYNWSELKHFFFTNLDGHTTLMADTVERLPGRLIMLIDSTQRESIQSIFGKYLPELEKEPQNFADKTIKSVLNRVNLEQTKK